jgi:hypothetical protein
MSQTVEVLPFFERGETSLDGFPAETYVGGFRGTDGATAGVEITLPAEVVEQAVLTGSCLCVSLSPDGRVVLDGDGLREESLEVASTAGGIRGQTLESLVAGCLRLDLLGGEDDPIADLTALREQMVRALAQLDATLEQLKKPQVR